MVPHTWSAMCKHCRPSLQAYFDVLIINQIRLFKLICVKIVFKVYGLSGGDHIELDCYGDAMHENKSRATSGLKLVLLDWFACQYPWRPFTFCCFQKCLFHVINQVIYQNTYAYIWRKLVPESRCSNGKSPILPTLVPRSRYLQQKLVWWPQSPALFMKD